jgi:hypothetical protein
MPVKSCEPAIHTLVHPGVFDWGDGVIAESCSQAIGPVCFVEVGVDRGGAPGGLGRGESTRQRWDPLSHPFSQPCG